MKLRTQIVLATIAALGFAHAAFGGNLQNGPSRVQRAPRAVLAQPAQAQFPAGPGNLQQAPLNCFDGFDKTKELKDSQGRTHLLECTTPVIVCPNTAQFATIAVDVQKLNGGGDDGSLRVRVTCQGWDPAG